MSGISSIADTGGLVNGGSIESSSSSTDSLTMSDFFSLLAAQLQYQDPLGSSDGSSGSDTSFLGQMAQFGALEQLENLSTQYNYVLAASLIGKTASYSSYDNITGDTNTGSGTVSSVNLTGTTPSCQIGDTWVSLSNITTVSA